ncbi:MAG: alpha/beta fold hydrolase [Elusimicrobia bacterium]|nr:alpha/beta fold hydrolase [Elusimicrobiota bacterium]
MKLALERSGNGAPLVFLHAFPLSRKMWEPQRVLSKNFQFIAVDFPGFGESLLETRSASMEQMARDVITTLDAADLKDPAIFIGLSMGGYVLLQLAKLFPERLRGLAMVSTRASADSIEARARRYQNIEIAEKEGAAALGEKMLPSLLGETTMKSRPAVVTTVRAIAAKQTAAAVSAALRGMAERPDMTETLSQIKCPVFVASGREDTVIKTSEMETMAKALPHAEFAAIDQVGHLLNLERPDVFNDLFLHFLKRRLL